jgi:hypothetical protein
MAEEAVSAADTVISHTAFYRVFRMKPTDPLLPQEDFSTLDNKPGN